MPKFHAIIVGRTIRKYGPVEKQSSSVSVECIIFQWQLEAVGDMYYMRLMLNHIRGATCFEDVITVNGFDTCIAMGLLFDDIKYISGLKEASLWGTARFLCDLFTIMLLSHNMSMLEEMWNKDMAFIIR